jgi:hypothetical protein
MHLQFFDTQATDKETWWRAEDRRYANYDEWAEFDQPSGSHLKIMFLPYTVDRHTPKGVFLTDGDFIRGKARKQLAVPTKALALRDLIIRKEHHVRGAKARLAQAQEHLAAAVAMMAKGDFNDGL